MFARVTTATVKRAGFEAALNLFRDTTIPIVRELDGLCDAMALGNRAENRAITLTVWASEEARRASGTNQAVIDNVAEFGPHVVGSFSRDQYEVVTDTWLRNSDDAGNLGLVRVTTALLRLDCWEAGVALVRDITGRTAGDPAGYRGSLAMVDGLTGKVLVLEVWDSRAAMASYDSTVHLHDRVARESQLLASAPIHSVFRIMSHGQGA